MRKAAIIECDKRDKILPTASVFKYTENGELFVKTVEVKEWSGQFLRYNYAKADFSDINEPGAYMVRYGGSESSVFRIDEDVFDRGVWHDVCHMDDAQMAAPGNYFDGYVQPEKSHSNLQIGQTGVNLNVGGWHDAGDFDLRIESQIGESYILAQAWEAFHPDIDATSIDFKNRVTEIHQPDGKNDILQQIENGALTVVNGYLALGRLYRGIICHNLRQYVLLGDSSSMTDNIPGNADDRWVFTDDGKRDVSAVAGLAAVSRVLKGHNDTLSYHCLEMQTSQTPYGVPYKPDIFSPEPVINAMNFVLGGGSSHYMFLILASRKLLQQRNN